MPSDAKREFRFRLRNDLQFAESSAATEGHLVIKDPLKLEYFLFEPRQRSLVNLLKQPLTIHQLLHQANEILRLDFVESEIKNFLQRLIADNLLIVESPGMGRALWQGRKQNHPIPLWQRIPGLLAIRFRGINPQRLLDWLNPFTSFLFQSAMLVMATCLFVVALAAMLLHLPAILHMEFLWNGVNNPGSLVPLIFAFIIVKTLHELGHALACRSQGHDCHEMGVMLLAFIPCLYCNVSDTWMEPKRWKRIIVSAAGIYVEMLIAAICVPLFLLCNSEPIQQTLFAIIMVCSINTLLINGNPLLRYDGYYILSDWLGIPNLHSTSRNTISKRISNFFTRSQFRSPNLPFSFLDAYAIASQVYRWFVIGMILAAIYFFLDRMELSNVGLTISVSLATIIFLSAIANSIRRFSHPNRRQSFDRLRVWATGIVLVAAIIGLANIPIETKTYGSGEITLEQGMIFAADTGSIEWLEAAGSIVHKGQPIAKISNEQLELQLLEQQHRVSALKLACEQSELLQKQGVQNSEELELNRDALTSAKRIAAKLQDNSDRLLLTAPVAGKLLPLPKLTNQKTDRSEFDLSRTQSTLMPENIGAAVETSEPVAIVCDLEQTTIQLHVPERNHHRLSDGQPVRLVVPQISPEIQTGIVDRVDAGYAKSSATSNGESGLDQVIVQVRFTEPPQETLLPGSRVHGAIVGETLPLFRVIGRFFQENFEL